MGYSKNRGTRVSVQSSDWISKDGLIKNFFYIRARRRFAGGKILPSTAYENLYCFVFVSYYV